MNSSGRRAGKLEGLWRSSRGFPVLLLALQPIAPYAWTESFIQGRLDPSRWQTTAEGDFREGTVDVVDVGKPGASDFRLRLRADTRGTRDDTVKFLGVGTTFRIPLGGPTRISLRLDWNEQANGSYLSAGLVLSPENTTGNPLQRRNWLKVEYVGVPPGKNARLAVSLKREGRERSLNSQGWPETNRAGRKLAVQNIEIVTVGGSFEVWENGALQYEAPEETLPFDSAYLYLQMSSHSNYPPREIFFDEIRVVEGH